MKLILKRQLHHMKSDAVTGIIYREDEGTTPYLPKRRDTLENIRYMIPEGTYEITMTYSPKFRRHLPLINVPGRSRILIHPGNLATDSRGCVLVGFRMPGSDQLIHSRIETNALVSEIESAFTRGKKVFITISSNF